MQHCMARAVGTTDREGGSEIGDNLKGRLDRAARIDGSMRAFANGSAIYGALTLYDAGTRYPDTLTTT